MKQGRGGRILPPPRRRQPAPRNRARICQPLSRCSSRSRCRRRRPMSASTRRRARCSREVTDAAADGRARRGRASSSTSRRSACSTPRRRTSSRCREALIARSWRRGARRPRRAGDAARRRPQDRQRRAQLGVRRTRPSRSTRTSSASATAPASRAARRRSRSSSSSTRSVPQPFRLHAHHWLILHGRYVCKARTPECWRCVVADLCAFKPKTPPPASKRPAAQQETDAMRSTDPDRPCRRCATRRPGGARDQPSGVPAATPDRRARNLRPAPRSIRADPRPQRPGDRFRHGGRQDLPQHAAAMLPAASGSRSVSATRRRIGQLCSADTITVLQSTGDNAARPAGWASSSR